MCARIKTYAHNKFRGLLWNCNYFFLRQPKVKSAIPHDPQIQEEVTENLKKNGFRIADFEIDLTEYKRFISAARYDRFPGYYGGGKSRNFPEKSLEHFISAELLRLSKDDIYIDVASAGAPTSEIYHDIYGVTSFQQDLIFPAGIHGNIIGSDASNMPVVDGFATKMGLHCSFEHFERDSDINFVKEARRVLSKKGKLCIVPLYLFNVYAVQTNLSGVLRNRIDFEGDATVYCAKNYGNRYGRFYDVDHFISRIQNNIGELKLTIYVIRNARDVSPSCYVKFIALLEKE